MLADYLITVCFAAVSVKAAPWCGKVSKRSRVVFKAHVRLFGIAATRTVCGLAQHSGHLGRETQQNLHSLFFINVSRHLFSSVTECMVRVSNVSIK